MNTNPPGPKQVLIVDDDEQTRDGLALVMEAAGHKVRTAANGLEALAAMRASPPDLVVLDLSMPTMDGWTFRMHQIEDPALAGVPVIVVSRGADGAERQAARLGIAGCLPKTSDGFEVLNLVGNLFDALDQGGRA
jgi:CheY-like chemotaxis protein